MINITRKITFRSFILPLLAPISFLFFVIIISFFLLLSFVVEENYLAISIYCSVLLFLIVPSLILQINYLKVDKNKTVNIDSTTNTLKITDNKIEFAFHLDEIDRIRMVNSKNYDDVFRTLSPWHPHYYYIICLKNDDEFLVTRLVIPKLERILNVRIVYKREVFPFISKSVLEKVKNGG